MLTLERKVKKYERAECTDYLGLYRQLGQKGCLTPRDKEVLMGLYRLRCLTSLQIARLYYGKKDDGALNTCATAIARRRLRMMYDYHLTDRFFIDVGENNGSSPQFAVLDNVGAYVVSGMLNIPVAELNWVKGINAAGLPYYQHTIEINDLYISMLDQCEARGYTLCEFLGEMHVRQSFDYGGYQYIVNPDGYFQMFTDTSGLHFFLELDRGTMTTGQFIKKVPRYAAYYASGDYKTHYETFPIVLVATTSMERAQLLKRAVESKDTTDMNWIFTSVDEMRRDLFDRIFLIKGKSAKVRLQDL